MEGLPTSAGYLGLGRPLLHVPLVFSGSHRAAQPEREGGRQILEFLELTLFIVIGAGSSLPMVRPWLGVDS